MKRYEFIEDGYAIRMDRLDTPYPWVNYLTNTRLSAMISQAGGGYLWYKVPSKFRITRYRYNQLPNDAPGFFVYIKEENGDVWCPTFQPMQDAETERHSIHRPGESVYVARHGDTEARLSFYILPDTDALVWDLTLTNRSDAEKTYQVYSYAELSQYHWSAEQSFGYYWQHMIRTTYDTENQILYYTCNYQYDDYTVKTSPLVYIASNLPVVSFCGDRDAFIGNYRSEANPIMLEGERCTNDEITSGNGSAVLHVAPRCGAGESVNAHFFIGVTEGAMVDYQKARAEALATVQKLRENAYVTTQKELLDARYREHFSHFLCEIPDKVAERQINYWGPLNALQFSLFHPTPQPSAPGVRTIGARDKLQALMPMVYRSPEGTKEGLLFMLDAQYTNGAISHNIRGMMNEFSMPGAFNIKKLKSDDLLWLPFLAYSVAAECGPDFLVSEKVGYCDLNGNHVDEQETVWEHLMRVIEFTQSHLGEHGIPLMLDGDWNDIISKFSHKGRGESVFAGQQYVAALIKMIEMAEYLGKEDDAARLRRYREEQTENLLRHAWNGKWWYRCFNDEGEPIGAESDVFGKLWLNPQSWAIISGVGSKEQNDAAYTAVEQILDTGYGLKLLTPGFKTYPEVMDPFSPYNPGTSENGAIFCHAHTWSIIAESKRGNAEKAWKFYNDLIPHNLHESLGTETYKSDPFGWVSNIVGPENSKHGWGNVIRLTGTCSWMNIAATQYLLGVRTTLGGVKFDPCIPSDWKGYKVQRDWRGCRLNVTFENPNGVSKGVTALVVDGVRVDGNFLAANLLAGKREVNVTVLMG